MPTSSSRFTRISIYLGLCWIYTCIHLDRQILGILAESVKSDLHISDAALGALTGSAFAIVYALLGLYFGRLADLSTRLHLVRIGAFIWSLASIGAAFANDYAALVIARAGVAAGEAVATAAAISLMADLAGERNLSRASSVFFACGFMGAGLAAVLGGAVIHWFAADSGMGWRAALVAAGIPGLIGVVYLSAFRFADGSRPPMTRDLVNLSHHWPLLLAAVLAVIAQMRLTPNQGVPAAVMIAGVAAVAWARGLLLEDPAAFRATLGNASFRWLLLAFAAVLFMDFAASFWLIPLALRNYGLSAQLAGAELGGLIIIGGIAGSLLGGWIADRWHLRTSAGRVWTVVIAVLLEALAICMATQATAYPAFRLAFGVFCLASGGWTGVAAALGMDLVPRLHRGTGIAIYFLVTTLLGPGLGAWAGGALGEWLGSLSHALVLCTAMAILAVASFVKLAHAVTRTPPIWECL